MKRTFISMMAVCCCICAGAQDFGSVLASISQNNTTLKALRSEADAAKLEARTGLTPDDPELELGYLWGTPREQGNRVDISLTQSFDFPTVYYWRSRIAAGEASVAEYEYAAQRRQILLEAEKTCIDIVYHNALAATLTRRLESAQTVADAWQKKYDNGSAGALDLNKARLNLLGAQKDFKANSVELEALLGELARLNGGNAISVSEAVFSPSLLPADFESWYASARDANPELQAVSAQLAVSQQQVKLSQAEWLPKLSVGYTSERIAGTTLQGIAGGISIPLWAGKGKVKAAKARSEALQARSDDAAQQFYNALRTKYMQAQGLSSIVEGYRQQLGELTSLEMLDKALYAGQIPLVEYVLEQSLWYDAMADALGSERDYQILAAELLQYAK